jgi:carboxymethylenebutenolidase
MPNERVTIRTPDGDCPMDVLVPPGHGPWPAVILYMDAGGIRPAMRDMARHLSEAGYVVALPDLFYCYGPYGPFVPREVFAGDFRATLGPLMATTDPQKAAGDTDAILAYLDTRADVAGATVGAVGFCMGGGMALAAAGRNPDRFAAVASFHGGNLATDAPTSPHRFVAKLWAEVTIAAAENDGSYPPAMAERLEVALTQAGVRYNSRIYPAAHGWMMPDFPVYDAEAAAQGWDALLALFRRTLPGGPRAGA